MKPLPPERLPSKAVISTDVKSSTSVKQARPSRRPKAVEGSRPFPLLTALMQKHNSKASAYSFKEDGVLRRLEGLERSDTEMRGKVLEMMNAYAPRTRLADTSLRDKMLEMREAHADLLTRQVVAETAIRVLQKELAFTAGGVKGSSLEMLEMQADIKQVRDYYNTMLYTKFRVFIKRVFSYF